MAYVTTILGLVLFVALKIDLPLTYLLDRNKDIKQVREREICKFRQPKKSLTLIVSALVDSRTSHESPKEVLDTPITKAHPFHHTKRKLISVEQRNVMNTGFSIVFEHKGPMIKNLGLKLYSACWEA